MQHSEATADKRKIKADVLLKEFDRALWEVHNRVEYRQRLINLQLLFIGALTAAYATIGKSGGADTLTNQLLWNTVPFIAIIFTVFLKEIAHQNYYRFKAASYINNFIRPKLREFTDDSLLMEWESNLRTEPDGKTNKRKVSHDYDEIEYDDKSLFFQPFYIICCIISNAIMLVSSITVTPHLVKNSNGFCKKVWGIFGGFDTIFSDIAFSLSVPPSCFMLQLSHFVYAHRIDINRNGFIHVLLKRLVFDEWNISRAIIWVVAICFYLDTVWRVWSVQDLKHDVVPDKKDTKDYLDYCNK